MFKVVPCYSKFEAHIWPHIGCGCAVCHGAQPPTQAFGLGREVVGLVDGDALPVSCKRDDPLRASWHILVPSAEVVREASRQRTGYGM